LINPPQNYFNENSIATLRGYDKGEIIIPNEEYNQRVEDCLSKLSRILKENKLTIRQLFKESIFFHEVTENITFEAIPLNNFLNDLSKYKTELDKKDAFCLLNKFKYLEDYESIDVIKLIDELNKYGYEENVQPNSELKELNEICDNTDQYVIQQNLVSLYKKYSFSIVSKEEKVDESKTEDIKIKNLYTQQVSKDQQFKNVFDELPENHEPSSGEHSPVKDKSKINSYQNLQSFAFSHKPTFGNLHVYENQVAEPDESLNIYELEKELDSEVEKFEEIK